MKRSKLRLTRGKIAGAVAVQRGGNIEMRLRGTYSDPRCLMTCSCSIPLI
jgi:hypothetical protein